MNTIPMARRGALVGLITALIVVIGACSPTRFPDNPEEHRLFAELETAGDAYYFNVRAGVASRIMGITPNETAREDVRWIRSRWATFDSFDQADDLTAYLFARGRREVAERIQAAIIENHEHLPPDGIDAHLEAAAVKQGLVDAVIQILEE